MSGKGVMTWPDGKRYEGTFFEDKKHGIGEFHWPNGNIYSGGWQYGKMHGQGTITNINEKRKFNCENGKRKQQIPFQ